jgi:hypothetical protein
MKRGGGGNSRRIWCGDRGSGSMAGEAGAALDGGGGTPLFWAWAERPNRPAGRLGRNLKRNSFWNKNWICEFTKALKICTRTFRRNFDVGIFPKFF